MWHFGSGKTWTLSNVEQDLKAQLNKGFTSKDCNYSMKWLVSAAAVAKLSMSNIVLTMCVDSGNEEKCYARE